MNYKDYKVSFKNGHFSAFNFKKLQRAGPHKSIKELRAEIDAKENEKKPP